MSVTAADVKALRDRTGAGMMDAKRALEEAGGDADKAVEVLRVKLGKNVAKLSGREAAEGTVADDDLGEGHEAGALHELRPAVRVL